MNIGGYKIRNKEGIHFITFAEVEWVDVFTRKEYRDIVVDSIRYCQQERSLQLHTWCPDEQSYPMRNKLTPVPTPTRKKHQSPTA